jgi:(1->4)-alpha-D-glucan 1-alpha-D-glucosylmutase
MPTNVPTLADEATRARGADPLPPFAALARDGKRQVIEQLFGAERGRLTRVVHRAASTDPSARDLSERDLEQAIVELTVALPVYRTYLRPGSAVAARDRRLVVRSARRAQARGTTTVRSAVAFVRDTLLSAEAEDAQPPASELALRWQQFSGAVTAKGVEDTALYRDPRVPSRAEVGCDPGHPVTSLDGYHRAMRRRVSRWPGALSAGSTHDTKRSEEVRARLGVLTEIPAWVRRFVRWRTWNGRHGGEGIDPLEEMAVYQALLGIWPAGGWERVDAELVTRLQDYAVKAAREAKTHSDWLEPNEAHEAALRGFVAGITSSRRTRFARDLSRFAPFVAFHGLQASLAEVVLRVASPGVPDVYLGMEITNPRLVDPDNRAPVDLRARATALEALDAALAHDPGEETRALRETWEDGRLKLLVLSRALRLRRHLPDLFARGRYVPVHARGPAARHALAFARRRRNAWALAVACRLSVSLTGRSTTRLRWPVGPRVWRSTRLLLPDGAPQRWRNAFTGGEVGAAGRAGSRALPLAEVLRDLPVALLVPAAT